MQVDGSNMEMGWGRWSKVTKLCSPPPLHHTHHQLLSSRPSIAYHTTKSIPSLTVILCYQLYDVMQGSNASNDDAMHSSVIQLSVCHQVSSHELILI